MTQNKRKQHLLNQETVRNKIKKRTTQQKLDLRSGDLIKNRSSKNIIQEGTYQKMLMTVNNLAGMNWSKKLSKLNHNSLIIIKNKFPIHRKIN